MNIKELYDSVPADVKENLFLASKWAEDILKKYEGEGHIMEISSDGHQVIAHFAKPEWSGDHCGSAKETGSQAIIMSICEYIIGEGYVS